MTWLTFLTLCEITPQLGATSKCTFLEIDRKMVQEGIALGFGHVKTAVLRLPKTRRRGIHPKPYYKPLTQGCYASTLRQQCGQGSSATPPLTLLGGSWAVISRVISRVTILITHNSRTYNPTLYFRLSQFGPSRQRWFRAEGERPTFEGLVV